MLQTLITMLDSLLYKLIMRLKALYLLTVIAMSTLLY